MCGPTGTQVRVFEQRGGRRLTGQQLNDGCEDKALALPQPEELQDEDEEGHAAQDGGQDHGGLHRLQVGWGGQSMGREGRGYSVKGAGLQG